MAYEARLNTAIPEPVNRRLRMAALLERKPIGRYLTDLLDSTLPRAEELAAELAAEPVAS